MNDKFSDSLESIIPEPTDTETLLAGARRKRRNHQIRMGVAAAAVVVALAVPAGLLLTGKDDVKIADPPSPTPTPSVTESETPSPEPTGTPEVSETPEESETPRETDSTEESEKPGGGQGAIPAPDPHPEHPVANMCLDGGEFRLPKDGEKVERGAVRAWFCEDSTWFGGGGPREPLVADVDRIVDAFEKLPDWTDPKCEMQDAVEPQTVVLEYPDGSTRVVLMDRTGCTETTDGSTKKGEGKDMFRDVVRLWEEQRESLRDTTVAHDFEAKCPYVENHLVPGRPEDVVQAYVCLNRNGDVTKVDVPQELMDEIVADLKSTKREQTDTDGTQSVDALVLKTKWGDDLALNPTADGKGYIFSGYVDEASEMSVPFLWTPSNDDLAKKVAALFG